VNGRERAATAKVTVRDRTFIESDRNQPGLIRVAQPKLIDRQSEFFVLECLVPTKAVLRKARDEDQGTVCYRTPDHYAPVVARPQSGGIPPYLDSSRFEYFLQPIDALLIVMNVRDEDMSGSGAIMFHDLTLLR
jgi:hypothetical protein